MSKMYTFSGSPEGHEHLDVMHKLLKQFVPFAQKRLGFNKPVEINLLSDPQNSKDPLGKTAYYDPNNMKIALFVDKRHPKDLMRSLAHELTHHAQNCRGEFDNLPKLGKDYAQTNKHMREMERQAYEGTMLLRDFEDNLKKETTQMNENKINEKMVGGSEDIPGLPSMGDVSVGLGDKPKSRMKLDQGTEYTVGALKAMKAGALQAMLDRAKAEGKKWSDLPASTPERVAYRKVNAAVKKVAGKADQEAVNLANFGIDEDDMIAAIGRPLPKAVTRAQAKEMARKAIEDRFGGLEDVVGGPMEEKLGDGKTQGTDSVDAGLDNNPEFTGQDFAAEKGGKRGTKNENWFKGDKDNLLFETLTKKWTK